MKKTTNNRGSYRKTVTYQAILLGGSTLIATALLSFGNIATKDAIALRLEEDLKRSISQVVPAELYDNDLLESTITETNANGESVLVYQATKENKVTAVIFEVSENGYSGEIRSILAVDPDGVLLGVRILAHTETPGLGDKIEVEKDDWVLGFDGLSLRNPPRQSWLVKKDGGQFDQFTGATITPRAVVKSIRAGLEFFEMKKHELLTPVVTAAPENGKTLESEANDVRDIEQ